MEKEYRILLESFRNSYFVRSLKYPNSLEYDNKEDKLSNINKKTPVTLNDISYKDGKYYLSGVFKIGEHVFDCSQFSNSFNESTRIGTYGSYESTAYFLNNDLKFETTYSAYRTLVGSNEEVSSIHDNIYDKKSTIVKNFIERVSGTFEEEFIYESDEDVYIHKSNKTSEIETLKFEITDEEVTMIKNTPKNDFNLVPRRQYAELKNERDRLIRMINQQKGREKTKEKGNNKPKEKDNSAHKKRRY